MIWKKPPHLPEVGEKVYGVLKDENSKRFFAFTMGENDALPHIERWCTQEEMKDHMNKTLIGVCNG